MKSHYIKTLWVFAALILVLPISAKAQPGPVVLTFMERIEYHTDATDVNGNIDSETYLYSLVSAYRKLGDNVFGNIYYLHKYSIDEGDTATHIGGVSLTQDISKKWKMTYSYSHSSNPERNAVTSPESDSDRLSFSLAYKLNPMEKARKRYTLKTTYSTGTDFSFGQTMSEKITVVDELTKRANYTLGYQFVWGLTDAPQRGLYRTHFANQWSMDLGYKLTKKDRLVLGVLVLDNLYHGAQTDDTILRLSYFRTVQ